MTTPSHPTWPPSPQQAPQSPTTQQPLTQQPPMYSPTQQPPTQQPVAQQTSSPGTPPAAHVATPEPAAWPAPAAPWSQPVAQDSSQSWPGAPSASGGVTPPPTPPSRLGALLGVVTIVLMGGGLAFPYYSTTYGAGDEYRSSSEYWLLPIWRTVSSDEPPETSVATMPAVVIGILVLVMVALAIAGWARRSFVSTTVAMAMLATLVTPSISSFIYNVQNDDGFYDEIALRPGGYLLIAAVLMSLVTLVWLLITRPRT